MMAKTTKYFLFILISNIFSQSQILWDFGVKVDEVKQSNNTEVIELQSKAKKINSKIDAAISDPFIKPNKIKMASNGTKDSDINSYISNPNQIKIMVDKSYFSKNYQNIINILDQQKLNSFSEKDHADLNYLLAESLYHTGKYLEAKDNIHNLLKEHQSDRLYFLLSRIYEAIGDIKSAKKSYIKLMTHYPDSDYFNSAKIKNNILNTF